MTEGEPQPSGPGSDGQSKDDRNAALRTVIELTMRTDLRRILNGCPIEQSGLRENLRTIATHARRHRLRAEELLILIKESTASLPEAREMMATPEKADTLSRMITIAVDEYYGQPSSATPTD